MYHDLSIFKIISFLTVVCNKNPEGYIWPYLNGSIHGN